MKDLYITVSGFIEFEPEAREANGKSVTQLVVSMANRADDLKVRLTIWPELPVPVPFKKGMYVSANGKYTKSEGKDGNEYHNLSVGRYLIHGQALERSQTGVAQSPSNSSSAAF